MTEKTLEERLDWLEQKVSILWQAFETMEKNTVNLWNIVNELSGKFSKELYK